MTHTPKGVKVKTPVKAVVVGALATLGLMLPSGAQARASDQLSRWSSDACTEGNFIIPTEASRLESRIPASYRDHLITLGEGPAKQAFLFVEFARCLDGLVATRDVTTRAPSAVEVIVMAMLEDTDHSDETFQFYTLANFTDNPALAESLIALGHPTRLVPKIEYVLEFDPLTNRLGALRVDVPAPGDHLRAIATVSALNPFDIAAAAEEFAVGGKGDVQVTHSATNFRLNWGAARLQADGGGFFSAVLGSSERVSLSGFFFDVTRGHQHFARVIKPSR